jgi:hypothetical protein
MLMGETNADIILELAKQGTPGIMLAPRHGQKEDIMVNIKYYSANITDESIQAQTLAEESDGRAWSYYLYERSAGRKGLDRNCFLKCILG